ncbi:hypothetical protein RC52_17905 [Herbaspirillum rubrisubalbicans]|nr:hypothetical protein [Herbaspirillum rubrisubalbicans]
MDQSRDTNRTNKLIQQHLEYIKDLQARGNPLGDYLWAEANDKKIVPDAVQDPVAIRELYQVAADKGSIDAQLVLAVKQFHDGGVEKVVRGGMAAVEKTYRQGLQVDAADASVIRRFDADPSLKSTYLIEDLADLPTKEASWKEALKKLDIGTKKQCFFYRTYIFAPQQRHCLAPRIAADEIWPEFRDGRKTYPKDSTLRDYWYDKAIACEQTPEYQKAVQQCPVFGSSSDRVKD